MNTTEQVKPNVPWADAPAGIKQAIRIYVNDLGALKAIEIAGDNTTAKAVMRGIALEGYMYNDGIVLQYYPAHTIRRVDLVGGTTTAYPARDVTLKADKETHANSKN